MLYAPDGMITEGIHDHLPSDDVMQEMLALALAGEDEEGVGMFKTTDFRGMAEMEWCCKVMYEYKKGKFAKTADLEFKGRAGADKKKSGELLEKTTV